MVRLAIIWPLLIVAGCSTVKPYPVCFYDPRPPAQNRIDAHVESLLRRIKMDITEVQATPDGRWIFAKTTTYQHDEISKTWPRVACIGNVTSGTEVKRNADCISHLEELLRKQNYLELDVKDNVVDSDEAPGVKHVICSRTP